MALKMRVTKVIKKDFFVSGDQIQKNFDQKELQIKMSSVMPFSFNAVELCVVTINDKPWTCAKKVCKALGYNKKTANIVKNHCSKENYAQKYQMSGVPAMVTPVDWLKDSQKFDIYINEEGMFEVLFSSQQPNAEDFRKHCCNVLFPHVRKQLKNKIEEDHQQSITRLQEGHQFSIEEDEQAMALLNDDLLEGDNRIQAI